MGQTGPKDRLGRKTLLSIYKYGLDPDKTPGRGNPGHRGRILE